MAAERLGREFVHTGMCFVYLLCFSLACRVMLEMAGWFRHPVPIGMLGVILLCAPAAFALKSLFHPHPNGLVGDLDFHVVFIRLCTTVVLLTIGARLLLHGLVCHGPGYFDFDSRVWRIVRHPREYPGRYPCPRDARRKTPAVRPPEDPNAVYRVTNVPNTKRGEG